MPTKQYSWKSNVWTKSPLLSRCIFEVICCISEVISSTFAYRKAVKFEDFIGHVKANLSKAIYQLAVILSALLHVA